MFFKLPWFNKAKDAIEILRLSVNQLKEARLELEQEDQ